MVPEITPGSKLSPPPAVAHGAAGEPAVTLDINLPNLITLARLFSVPLAVWLILDERYGAAFWVFLAAGLSDGIDGYIAKRFDRRTRLGALLDPAADKILLSGVFVTLWLVRQLPDALVILVILRDVLIVAGFFLIQAIGGPRQLRPLIISKLNTLAQLTLVGFVLAQGVGIENHTAKWLLVVLAGTTTVLSGVSYLIRLARILAGAETA